MGAAVVFCCQTISSSQLAFALSLAGSVMMTVSFYSILPECFRIEDEASSSSSYLSITSLLFWHRCFGFGLGGFSYFCLAKCAFPEPNELIFGSEDEGDDKENGKFDDDEEKLDNNQQDEQVRRDEEKEQLLQQRLTQKTSQSALYPISSTSFISGSSSPSYNKQYKPLSSSFWHGTDLTHAHAKRAWRVALLLFVSLFVHNFPEGLAVAASTLHSPHLGITTTIAIALHNIPEGIAVAVPCLAARPNAPWMAFALASASGLAEPAGALVALWLLPQNQDEDNDNNSKNDEWMKNILAYVAGIMIMVAVRELFPEAWKNVRHQKRKTPLLWGTLMGVFIMVGSEAVLE